MTCWTATSKSADRAASKTPQHGAGDPRPHPIERGSSMNRTVAGVDYQAVEPTGCPGCNECIGFSSDFLCHQLSKSIDEIGCMTHNLVWKPACSPAVPDSRTTCLTAENEQLRAECDRLRGWLEKIAGGDNPCLDELTLRTWAFDALRLTCNCEGE